MTGQGTGCYALIAGGGTAGHVLPGIAIATELVRREHSADSIHFVGSERGVEKTFVPDSGFGLTLLPGRGIQRRLTAENIGAVSGLIRAFAKARSLHNTLDPSVVVALGGYASVPAALWALPRRVPVIVAEQNAVPGLANRIVGRFAKACAVSYEGTELPRARFTGNPVRPEILAAAQASEADIAEARQNLNAAPGQSLVVIFGGSLGARTINEATIEMLRYLSDRGDIHIRHIIGDRDHDSIVARVPDRPMTGIGYEPIRYENDMATVYAAADLVVARSGATTCAELAVTGTPAVLIPLPTAPGDHQTANARVLERAGGVELLPDSLVDGRLLADTVKRLLADREALGLMREAALRVARPDAAGAIADLVEEHATRVS